MEGYHGKEKGFESVYLYINGVNNYRSIFGDTGNSCSGNNCATNRLCLVEEVAG